MCVLRPVLLIPILLLMTLSARGQQWVDLMMDDTTNIHVVKAAFDEAWEGRPYVKGKGWKQFQRWYWFMEQRTWPNGERPDAAVYMEAAVAVRAMRSEGSGDRDDAVWEPIGPIDWSSTSYNPGNGRVNCVAVDPSNSDIIYVGTPASGIWRSNDNGVTWEALFTDLPSMGVSGIVIDTSGTGTIYIATGDGDGSDTYSAGVLKSTDNGSTWQPTGLSWNISQTRTTRTLRMHPHDPGVMLCATSVGLLRTADTTATWQTVLTGSFRDVEFMPGDTTLIYACSDQLFRSVSNGTAFTATGINGLPANGVVGRMAVAVTPADPSVVYVLCSRQDDNSFLGLYRSDDSGSNFSLRSETPNIFGYAVDGTDGAGQAWYDMALAVDPLDANIVYVGGINVWKSVDGGTTWEIKSHWTWPSVVGYTHADIHSLDFFGDRLYCGSDGGIHISNDGGEEWLDHSAGLDITQFYRLGGSELTPQLILAGAQDNGSNRYLDGQWTHVFGADGMEAAVDPEDPNVLYSTSQNGGLRRSDNGGTDWTGIEPPDEGAWVTPFVMDPTFPGRMLAGYTNLWASDNRGEDWYQLTWHDDTQYIRAIAAAPIDGAYIYVARNDLVERSLNGGFVWTDIRPGLPGVSPTSFTVDHEDPYHVWISFSGSAPGNKVFESFNGGLNWINRSLNLPNVPVNSIVVQANSPHGLYAGTDLGVFYIDDYTPDWQPYGTGMPNLRVMELEINYASGKLRAATFGRGIWETDLYVSPFASVQDQALGEGPHVFAVDLEGRYRVQGNASTGKLNNVRVVDPLGRQLLQRSTGAMNEFTLDLGDRAPGTYLVLVSAEQGTWCRRVQR